MPSFDFNVFDREPQTVREVLSGFFLNLSYFHGRTIAEFVGAEPGLDAVLDDVAGAAFKQAVGQLYREDLRGDYCRLSKYADGDELGLIATHGAHVATMPVVRDWVRACCAIGRPYRRGSRTVRESAG